MHSNLKGGTQTLKDKLTMKNFWILIMTFILTACGQDNDAQNNLIESEAYLKNNLFIENEKACGRFFGVL